MNERDIDTPRLVADLKTLALQARALKARLRRRWTRPMADEQLELHGLARRATALCILRAHTRGRLHVTKRPRDGLAPDAEWDAHSYNARIAARVAREYGGLVSDADA